MCTPSKPKLVIWGASGHASVVADCIQLQAQYELMGCVDDKNPMKRTILAGEVLGGSDILDELRRQGATHLIIGIGDNTLRCRLAERAIQLGYVLATVIHPAAVVAGSAKLGPGTVVMAGAVVNPGAVVGANCIINTCASVDHDCNLADGVHICPGTHLAGNVHIGHGTMIGVGSAVRDRVRIGRHCVIGAGAAVVCDIPDESVAVGVPAKVIRTHACDPV